MELCSERDVVPGKLDLETKTRSPYDCGEEEDDEAGDDSSVPSLEWEFIGKQTNDD